MLNIVVPMAGAGSRFAAVGFKDPKPLIPVHGKPMIQWVIHNLRPTEPHRFIFICQRAHVRQYGLTPLLQRWAPGCQVIQLDVLTEGAACTVLQARHLIDDANPLMIANSDQYIDIDINRYLQASRAKGLDGLIMTMHADDPKWSYASRGPTGHVTRVAEKQVISNEATVGIYNFARGSDFVGAAQAMIARGERVNGEFYVAPTYNALIAQGRKIGIHNIGQEGDGMHGLGTPDDLALFLEHPVSHQHVEA